ncbi:hypothetical protein PBI_HUFFY_45 [Gordonia phage Huffy]|uniref:Uncharacterized protein n=3 Tax=Vendettavirus TaxID=2049885 RepID=A0A160DD29_9CAUD|nr:hypothetical protein BH795_gp67 [Gordonia phage Vendetta]YP_009275398.1 hypothetical protein BH760_gp67 [Gordonia phage Splinter]YP_010051134.1 hypothetical protein KDJ61_gp70 [Gordonia phage TZGordon]AQY55647.1 hypothetical protein PBI_HUFFY_45 [Gordonia phage Huffy]AQY55729.1 hypothetical protein PBI_DINODARYN_45 [Gordonia phage DinoDaryn]WNO25788.1 hypothetical protein SEA_GOIB_46 [Gordonia phage Goib]ANA85591.1 hypothetical protein PBI_VENDETTA_44 [Gordonia phage Vendetta]ANA85670.1 h
MIGEELTADQWAELLFSDDRGRVRELSLMAGVAVVEL